MLASPVPAATVVVLRPGDRHFEVLMVERNARGFFGSLFVFPGGRVDTQDVASEGSVHDDASHRNAALRELAEETGILLTARGAEAAPDLLWFEEHRDRLAVDDLILVSRWVTPEGAPSRFDTRFYLAVCAETPEIRIDANELVGHAWVEPAEALDRHRRGEWAMMLPTIAHLRWLARRASVEDAVASATGADGRTLVRPELLADGSIVPVLLPEEVG